MALLNESCRRTLRSDVNCRRVTDPASLAFG